MSSHPSSRQRARCQTTGPVSSRPLDLCKATRLGMDKEIDHLTVRQSYRQAQFKHSIIETTWHSTQPVRPLKYFQLSEIEIESSLCVCVCECVTHSQYCSLGLCTGMLVMSSFGQVSFSHSVMLAIITGSLQLAARVMLHTSVEIRSHSQIGKVTWHSVQVHLDHVH